MTTAKRKLTSSLNRQGLRPAKRLAAGRQLIVENAVPGTTRYRLKQISKPYKIVDEVKFQALEDGASRHTALVTLVKPNCVDEAQDIDSRLSGTVLNGKQVSIRMFGKPSTSSTALAEADSAPCEGADPLEFTGGPQQTCDSRQNQHCRIGVEVHVVQRC